MGPKLAAVSLVLLTFLTNSLQAALLPSAYKTSTQPAEDQPTTFEDCSKLPNGAHGACFGPYFIICSDGRLVNSITCPLGKGYDPSIQNCRIFREINSIFCDMEIDDELASEEDTTIAAYGDEKPASDAPAQIDTTVVVVTDSYSRADEESEEEEDAGYEQKCTPGSRASTGFCVKNYLECTATGYVEKSCRVGKLFDSNSNRCVARIACQKKAYRDVKNMITTNPAKTNKVDGRCAHVEEEDDFAWMYVTCLLVFLLIGVLCSNWLYGIRALFSAIKRTIRRFKTD